jgi:GT2 family glycosyltransferase
LTSQAVSVVVPSDLSRWDLTRICLAELSLQLGPDDEVLIVTPPTTSMAVDIPQTSLVPAARAGSASQRNAGLEAARNDIVVFVDDDIELLPGSLEALRRAFDDDWVDGASGRLQGVASRRPRGPSWLHRLALAQPGPGRVSRSGINQSVAGLGAGATVEWMPGGLAAYRVSRLDGLRFDERLEADPLPGYALGEDLDLSFRLYRRGRRFVYRADALAKHHGGEDWKSGSRDYWEKKALVRRYLASKPEMGISKGAMAWSLLAEAIAQLPSLRTDHGSAAFRGLMRGSLGPNPLLVESSPNTNAST